MKELEIIGISCLLIISTIFYVLRKRMILYHVLCITTIAAFVLISSRYVGASSGARLLLLFGLGLYWFGLTIVRIMLNRSVSLNLLASLRDGLSNSTVKEDIAGRLKDAQHYRLVSTMNETYHLTWFGGIFALLTSIAYHVFRIEK